MTVRVDEMTTDVTAEAPAARSAENAAQGADWRELDRLAAARARQARDHARTHAAGFDD